MSAAISSFRALARCMPEALVCVSTSGEVLAFNQPAQQMLGGGTRGQQLAALASEEAEAIARYLRMCSRSRSFLPGTLHLEREDGSVRELRTSGVRLELADGEGPTVLLRLEDKQAATAVFAALNRELDKLTAQRRRLNKQRELIRRQRAELREYSAPMIDVWDGVVLAPLFGVIDDAYVERILTNLLDMVTLRRARWVILDLTATPGSSARLAAGMARVARAVRLVGARCILSGLSPDLARRFAAEGGMPRELATVRDLQTALAMCLAAD